HRVHLDGHVRSLQGGAGGQGVACARAGAVRIHRRRRVSAQGARGRRLCALSRGHRVRQEGARLRPRGGEAGARARDQVGMKRLAPWCGLVLLVGGLPLLAGCPGNDLRGRTHGIRDLIREARENGAYKCAPRELAMAESHLEFANTELDDGKYFPAKREVAVAEDNARKALALSPKDRCNPPPKPPDTDGDGIIDKLDKCPTEPEDKDGFE